MKSICTVMLTCALLTFGCQSDDTAIVDVLQKASSRWAATGGPGACCGGGATTCWDAGSESSCEGAGGTYIGEGTVCPYAAAQSNFCSQHTRVGVCCQDGMCVHNVGKLECNNNLGFWLGSTGRYTTAGSTEPCPEGTSGDCWSCPEGGSCQAAHYALNGDGTCNTEGTFQLQYWNVEAACELYYRSGDPATDCGTVPATETSCTDNGDQDCDGLFDCADPDCDSSPDCGAPATCNNDGVCDSWETHCDNDPDKALCPNDCPYYSSDEGQNPGECSDYIDNDCDGTRDDNYTGIPTDDGCFGACCRDNFGAYDCIDGGTSGGCGATGDSFLGNGTTCMDDGLACDYCGVGGCQAWETPANCPQDCDGGGGGSCNNDGTCDAGEDCDTCPDDCASKAKGKNQYCCGDGTCDQGEDGSFCAVDCGAPPADVCGDGSCTGSEDCSSCEADCGTCGGGGGAKGDSCNVDGDCDSNKCKNGTCR